MQPRPPQLHPPLQRSRPPPHPTQPTRPTRSKPERPPTRPRPLQTLPRPPQRSIPRIRGDKVVDSTRCPGTASTVRGRPTRGAVPTWQIVPAATATRTSATDTAGRATAPCHAATSGANTVPATDPERHRPVPPARCRGRHEGTDNHGSVHSTATPTTAGARTGVSSTTARSAGGSRGGLTKLICSSARPSVLDAMSVMPSIRGSIVLSRESWGGVFPAVILGWADIYMLDTAPQGVLPVSRADVARTAAGPFFGALGPRPSIGIGSMSGTNTLANSATTPST